MQNDTPDNMEQTGSDQNVIVRLASDEREIEGAQRLRYRVCYEDRAATAEK